MSRVCCVTGAAGYIGSWLVKKLLDRGYVVHATVRNLGDEKKVGLLRALPGAGERLWLFEADLYDAASFEQAIAGCKFVFLVAAPMLRHCSDDTDSKDATEAIVDATRTILQLCERSKTVRRVIYTASVVAASPLKDDGSGFKDVVDESCWTPLNLSYAYSNEGLNAYVSSKVLSEKALLAYNSSLSQGFEVVTLACGLVGGDSLLRHTLPDSVRAAVSPLTGDKAWHNGLSFMQALLRAVPLVHVDDVCEAHVFCAERPPGSLAGRFLCAAASPGMQDIVDHYARRHPKMKLRITEVVGDGVRVQVGTSKLEHLGFKYRYGAEEVLDGSVECAKRLGVLCDG